MTTEELVKNLLDQCYALKREHEGSFSLRGFKFTRANLDGLIIWLEDGGSFELNKSEKYLLAILMD